MFILNKVVYLRTSNELKQKKMETLEIIYLSIEEMDASLDQANADEKLTIQSKINYAFELIDKIKGRK